MSQHSRGSRISTDPEKHFSSAPSGGEVPPFTIAAAGLSWDLFCRVVDNFGDIGVAWRLARRLAQLGLEPISVVSEAPSHRVRLWVDDLATFQKLAPSLDLTAQSQILGNIEVCQWTSPFPPATPADVVVETFGCELPASYVSQMNERAETPVWINLEYLSAEPWVDECHLLPSPRSESRLEKHFFFPGFTEQTGGLLREAGLRQTRHAFGPDDASALWQSVGIEPPQFDSITVSLFCYETPVLAHFLRTWEASTIPVRVLAFPGAATQQASAKLGSHLINPGERISRGWLSVFGIPFLPHELYDQVLWACDLNVVRGEDSFVRAQWAEKPLIWHIYPQQSQTHLVKLDAFLARYQAGLIETNPGAAACATALGDLSRLWNAPDTSLPNFPGLVEAAWQKFVETRQFSASACARWAGQLDRRDDLANNLARFAVEKRAEKLQLRRIAGSMPGDGSEIDQSPTNRP